MKLVVDANVVISALIADSKTRELIATLEPALLTPEFVYDEIENYTELIVEKSWTRWSNEKVARALSGRGCIRGPHRLSPCEKPERGRGRF